MNFDIQIAHKPNVATNQANHFIWCAMKSQRQNKIRLQSPFHVARRHEDGDGMKATVTTPIEANRLKSNLSSKLPQ